MRLLVAVLVLALIGGVLCEDKPSLIVSKVVTTKNPVVNNNALVSIRIFNIGTSPAYDVKLDDSRWPVANFTLAQGDGTAAWDEIPEGTNVTYSYILKPTKAGNYYTEAAVIEYRHSPKSQPVYSYSAHQGILRVKRANEVDRQVSIPHFREWGIALVLALASIGIPLLTYFRIATGYENGVSKAFLAKSKKQN